MSESDWESNMSRIEQARSESEQLVPVIGAGVSIQLGLPGWEDLVTNIADSLGEDQSQLPDDTHRALQKLKGGRETRFVNEVRRQLEISRGYTSKTLQAVVSSSSSYKVIVTTNIDFAIEEAFTMADRPLAPSNVAKGFAPGALNLIEEARPNRQPVLLKIHGSLERPSTWVLTRKEYKEAYDSRNALHDFIINKIDIPLFIATSLSDPHIVDGIECRRDIWKDGGRGYALVHYEKTQRKRLLDQIGVIPIEFEQFDEIPEIIDSIFDCPPLEIAYKTSNTRSSSLRVGAASIRIDDNSSIMGEGETVLTPNGSQLSKVSPVLANALEFHNNRQHGPRNEYINKIVRFLDEDEEELRLIFRGLVQYPSLLEDCASQILRRDVDQFQFFDLLFEAAADDLHDGFVDFLQGRVFSEKLGEAERYRARKRMSKLLVKYEIHPATKFPPVTVEVDNLQVPMFPLTQLQGEYLHGESLTDGVRYQKSIRPYTIDSIEEVDSILDALRRETGQPWKLPTVDEWNHIAELDRNQIWPWGNAEPKRKVHANLHYVGQDRLRNSGPIFVGAFPKGTPSRADLYDLIENVYELVRKDGEFRLAGGAWTKSYPNDGYFNKIGKLRSSVNQKDNIGIRPVYNPDANIE